MDTRLGWIASGFALLLVFGRMSSLLIEGVSTVPWLPVLLAALILGGLTTAGAMRAGAPPQVLALISLIGSLLALTRVAAGSTLALGLIPTSATPSALSDEIGVALEIIRFGAAPVLALPGLVGVLAAIVWLLAAGVVHGGVKRRPAQMVLPPIGLYFVLATLDRSPPRWWWPAGLALVGALGLMASNARRAPGRVRNVHSGEVVRGAGRALPVTVVASLVLAAVLSSGAFAATVPESGVVAWRNATGFGGGLFGGISYNLFASMQQDLVGNDSTVLFVARVSEASPPNEELYWKLITLDTFDGEFWLPGNFAINLPRGDDSWEASDFTFVGPTVRVEQVVQIIALRQNYLPILYSPVALSSENPLLHESFRVREDGSIKFDARTSEGLIYRVTSDIPRPDISVLASTGGELSPIFAEAAAAGEISITPSSGQTPLPPARVREDYLSITSNLPRPVVELSRAVTEGASTNFERALLLEAFFRSSGLFTYDAGASTGHSTLDLAAWLLDPESRNHRTGYCEQFAAAMAVMARTIGIPSRVVMGFTPGEETVDANGDDLIVVRARNAHAWVELYFGGQGWVRFDPTPRADQANTATVEGVGFDPVAFLPDPGEPGDGTNPNAPNPLRPDEEFLEPGADPTIGLPSTAGTNILRWLLVPLVAAAIISPVPAFKWVRRRSRLGRVESGDISAGWDEITDRLVDLGLSLNPSLTPIEIATSADRGLVPLARAVSAYLYGGLTGTDQGGLFSLSEDRLRSQHQGWRWWRSWISPKSIIARIRKRVSLRFWGDSPVAELASRQ